MCCIARFEAREVPTENIHHSDGEEGADDATDVDDDIEETTAESPAQTPVKKKPSSSIQDISTALAKMTVVATPFSFVFTFPYLLYTYKEGGRNRCAIDFLVIAMGQEFYRPLVPRGGKELQVGMVLPKFFVKKDRVMQAHGDDENFTDDTHKATAFDDLADKIEKKHNVEERLEFLAPPQTVHLPFECEEEIFDWTMQAFENDDDEFTDNCGGMQYFFVLSVVLQSVEKKTEKKQGGFRLFQSPNRGGDAMNVEEDRKSVV